MPRKMGPQIEKAMVSGTSQFSDRSENSLGLRAELKKIPKEEKSQISGVAIKIII